MLNIDPWNMVMICDFSKVLIQAGYECDSSERRIDSGTV